jgi:hypothetical protein
MVQLGRLTGNLRTKLSSKGDCEADVTKIKVSPGGFDSATADGKTDVVWAARVTFERKADSPIYWKR